MKNVISICQLLVCGYEPNTLAEYQYKEKIFVQTTSRQHSDNYDINKAIKNKKIHLGMNLAKRQKIMTSYKRN